MGRSSRFQFNVLKADLDVDTNRDGTVDNMADDINEHIWNTSSGAIFSVNYDRDGMRTVGDIPIGDAIHFDDTGAPVLEDKRIDNSDDARDITPLVIRKIMDSIPASAHVFEAASLEDIQSIHVFKRIQAGETSIWGGVGNRVEGGAAEPLEIEITDWVNPASSNYQGDISGATTFGIEGLFFRSLGLSPVNQFDGVVNLTLEVREGEVVIASDVVEFKVAPG
ncbi:MAG: hypothetical protein IPG76_22870 [Acidobacteria bacterium]|nr:hypothetical protein [Acidobacteriota bacterium]